MKALRKSLKYSLILLALLAGALLLAPLFIDMDDIRAGIEREVEDATGRALTIGEVRASLFPWIGVRLSDVRLANRAGFTDAPMFRAESVEVKVALLPLLGGRYEVRNFTLVAPEMRLERRADGRTNWDDLTGGGSAAVSRQTSPAGKAAADDATTRTLPPFLAETVRVERGRLIWRDAETGGEAAPLVVEDMTLSVDDVRFDRPVRFDLHARVLEGPLDVHGEIGPLGPPRDWDPARIAARIAWEWTQAAPASWPGIAGHWPAQLAGVGLGVAQTRIALTGELEQHEDGARAAKGMLALAGAHEFALGWTLSLSDGRWLKIRRLNLAVDGRDWLEGQGELELDKQHGWRMRLKSAAIERAWLAALVPAVARIYATHPAPWKTLAFGALIAGDGDRLDIRDLQLRPDGDLVQISGGIGLAGPDIRLRAAAKSLHLDPWMPKGPAPASGGDARAAANQAAPASGEGQAAPEPDLRFLKDWRVDIRLQADRLLAGGLDARDVQAAIIGREGRFTIDPLRFGLSGGIVEEKAEVDASVWPVRWRESARLTGIRLGPVLQAVAGMDWIDGVLEMRTRLRGQGLSARAVNTLTGDGRVQLSEGRIRGVDLVAMLQSLGKGGLGDKAGTRFTQLSASFTSRNGVFDSQDLFMVSPYLRVSGKGVVNLPAKSLDWRLRPRLTGGGKGVVIPVRIHGPLGAPKVVPDLDAETLVGEALRRGAGGRSAKDVGRRLEKELGGALKSLLPGGR
ncbi:MAG: AsmA family protein [Mariprofundaceae bacterium]